VFFVKNGISSHKHCLLWRIGRPADVVLETEDWENWETEAVLLNNK
jgi:hypothetical protein